MPQLPTNMNEDAVLQQLVVDALNDQIHKELYSAYLYLGMSAHLEGQGYEGFSQWMRLQAQEELAHGMRLYDYVLHRGERVELHAMDAPPTGFGDPLAVFELALEHEREVTASIHALYGLAGEHADLATQRELDWFIIEQVEEEQTALRAVALLTKAAGSDPALLMLDREFGERGSAGDED